MASTENSCLKNLAGELLVGLSADLLVDSASAPPRGSAQLQQLSPAALAYVGDAVYELYIRTHYLFPPKRLQVYHHQVVAQVRAESQARHLKSLQPHLTETECEIVRRGRNAASKGPKRVDPDIYQQATALETLFGYLYLCDPQRLVQLLSQLQLRADSVDANNADANSANASNANANSADTNSADANSADANAKDAPVSLG